MRVAIGRFGAESNSFNIESPISHVEEAISGQELISKNIGKRTVLGGFLDVIGNEGITVIPTLSVWWGATGVVSKESYEHFKAELLKCIEKAGELDGILLDLHGAMVAENAPDAEGTLLKEVRETVGENIPIVAVLDIHGNITDLKVEMADALLGYRTNPHIDLYERGKKAAQLMLSILKGRAKPVILLKRLPMLGPNLGMSTWAYKEEDEKSLPFVRIMNHLLELEKRQGIIDISIFIGFPYSDISECLTSVLVVSQDDSKPIAEEIVNELSEMIWKARREFINVRPLVPVDEALEIAIKSPDGPIILVDTGDNSGGGAPCDNTVILEALIQKGAEDAVFPIRDPEVVSLAIESGVGSVIDTSIGGKIDKRFYKPVRVKAYVKGLFDGKYWIRGPHHGGGYGQMRRNFLPREYWKKVDVGKTALLEVNGIEIIVSEGRVGMEQDYYKCAGVDPSQRKIVVVKSHQAHRASFESIAKRIIEVNTPGCTSPSYKGLTFKNIPRPVFPLDPL